MFAEPWSALRHRRVRIAVVVLGLACMLPTLGAGFFADDYVQIAKIEGWSVDPAGPLDLYSFVPGDPAEVERLRGQGALPWFTAPGLKLSFWRPLSSGLMWLDHALFGRAPLGYHVHTLLWYGALLVTVALLLARALPPALATLAIVLFCLEDAHAMAAGWVAARNATVACTAVFLGLLAHIRWRRQGWSAGAWLAPLAAAVGLGAGEMALGALCYLLAWELTGARPGRLRAVAPTLGLVVVYLIIYGVTDSGARNAGTYLDPAGDPVGFLRELPARLVLLSGCLLGSTPLDFTLFDERLRAPLLLAGVGLIALVAVWLPRALRRLPADEAAAVRWLGLGGAGALLVSAPGILGERVLLAAGPGGAAVLSCLMIDAWRICRGGHGRRRVLAAVGFGVLALPNLVFTPLSLPAKSAYFGSIFERYRTLIRQAEIAAPVPAQVVVLALDDLVAMHLPLVRAFEQGWPAAELRRVIEDPTAAGLPLPDRLGYRGTTVLSLSRARHRLVTTGPRSFELFTPEGTLLDGAWAQTMRKPELPLPAGSMVRGSGFTATVLTDREGRPTRVELRFDRPLDDPALVFLVLDGDRLRRFRFPTNGETADVPQSRAMLGLPEP